MFADLNAPDFDRKHFLTSITSKPGVYRMLDADGKFLYVGKAKNLNRRVSSYFRRTGFNSRIQSMLHAACAIEITVTRNEAEALLLENNLIKEHRPRYNVLLRDDKSYPYIYFSGEHEFPRLYFYRGARPGRGRSFGPYASAGAVRESLNLLQKTFRLRNCEDSVFRNRTRPCLQHQINRCTAPCVGLVEPSTYREDVEHAVKFLEGRSSEVISALVERMDAASSALEFESAAQIRDQIEVLRKVSEKQYVSTGSGDLDVIAVHAIEGHACVLVMSMRGGLSLGDKTYFPQHSRGMADSALLTAFIGQYYLQRDVPAQVLVNMRPRDSAALSEMLTLRRGKEAQIVHVTRGTRTRWIEMASRNAELALMTRLAGRRNMHSRLEALRQFLQMESAPKRMECFDISHTMGEAAVASCVVFDSDGPQKAAYRRYNITDIEPGDDYAAMRQALTRRLRRREESGLPDVLFIDGGKGQVRQARDVIRTLEISGIIVIGISKGPDRRPGQENLLLSSTDEVTILPPDSPALLLIQQIRDEAHRFAIAGHRQRRAKTRSTSSLEAIDGLGPRRRQNLIKHFGGLRSINRAGVEDLSLAPGISKSLAHKIYEHLHGSD